VHVQTPEERKAWMDATAGVWTQFETQVGKPLIDRVRGYSK
jgi:hypothetical protein